jgi:hypothetical protein
MSAESNDTAGDLDRRIDRIEAGYEFLLAYAAQGRETDQGPGSGGSVREHLANMEQALDGLGEVVSNAMRERGQQLADTAVDFLAAVSEDARRSRSAVCVVLAQRHISSQLVDNLNASVHVRALLTDLFLVDAVLKSKQAG